MTEDQRKEFLFRLNYSANLLARFAQLDAPDVILASQVMSIFTMSAGYLGKDLTDHFGRLLTTIGRRYVGLCQTCDTELPPARCYEPACDQCEAKATAEYFKFEVENPDLFEDQEP